MKTFIVISDTHGNRAAIDKLDPLFAESDYIIHLGDTSGDGAAIRKRYPDKTCLLNGNCDIMRCGESETILDVEGVRIFACHGDRYGVKRTYERIAEKAREEGCGVALFGHTHQATEEEMYGVKLFNPGTLSRYSHKSYLYLVVSDGKASGKIVDADALIES